MKTKFLQRVMWMVIPLLTMFTTSAWGGTYELYSGTITEGDYIIVYSGKAMKNSTTASRWDYESVSVSQNKITNPTNEANIVWHIAASGTYWTIYSANASKYAVGTGSKNTGGMDANPSNNGEKWTVSGTSTYEFVNKRNKDASVNANLRNNGTYGFACYGTGTGGALSLYKLKASTPTTIVLSEAGSESTVSGTHYVGDSYTLPTSTEASCGSKVLVGWSTEEVSETNTKPASNFYVTGATVTLGSTNKFYAVFATITSSSTTTTAYSKYSGSLTTGDYVFRYGDYVMGNTISSNRCTNGTFPTITEDVIASPAAAIVWTIGTSTVNNTTYYTLYNANVSKYLAKTSQNNQASLVTSVSDNGARYTCSSNANSTTYDFINAGNSRYLRNNGSNGWAMYSSSTGGALTLYKKGTVTTTVYDTTAYATSCGSTYTITLANSGTVTGGTFTASAASASQGTVITLTATPERGYGLGSWNVTDASSNPVTVTSNQFTMPSSNVTVSATFNALTPLTITLSTKSKGTFTNPDPWPIYSGETFIFPSVTPNDPTCAKFVGWIAGTTFDGDGSTHDAPTGLITAGTESTAQTTDATYTAVFYETETTESDAYVKVTSAPANWANDHYLIVYEGDATHAAVAFDGKRDNGDNGNIDAASNGVEVTITNDAIAKTARLAAAEWRIAAVTGGYSIQSASGFYIGQTTDANGLQNNSSTAYVNTLAYSSGFSVTGSGNAVMRYNYASDQLRFRYYKSSSYSSQQVIQLYKLGTAEVQTRTYTTNPSCTPKYRVTVTSVTGGSPNADPRYNPETTEVSLTANPSAGYAFTSWTITKTTGGDNVTTTLLPGAKATTANTTFSMPAYDVTVTAAYSKKAVMELKVMDGSTVVANTTGSVSGTLNVSTGANKTLDVVITPADAFDHSWTASVTAGGTYASISNVTDAGFRVNGLAQGDATVTVTAPNDGSAKVVTFTVHVTDVLPSEIILKRDGSETPINALTIYLDQYAKINVSYSPTPTDKAFTFSSADATSVSSHAHASTSGYETLHGLKVTSSPVNCTFTSTATGSVTKVLAVTVLPCPADQFVDYIHGNATVTRAAQVSADHWSINTSITTPTLSDAAESASADCEAGHYHLIGWLPQSIAEALFAAGTPITSATEGLVAAGAEIEASGITWYAIWAKKE